MSTLTRSDFQSGNEVRWCPGCGDYAILATVQKTLAYLSICKSNTVFVSGIGCAARFPYYMNTYGIHTIHGRGPAFASGIKLANPKLNVFLVTGDGDGLSIGASHLLHLFRRNIDVTVLLFNNQIYGLTKGQYSPTSPSGHVGKSTPWGSIEQPINPIRFALLGGATFVARSIDNDAQHLQDTLQAAISHKGCSFIEILQNCVVFNDKVFGPVRDKSKRDQHVLVLKEREPLLFDKGQKAIAIDRQSFAIEVTDDHTNKDIIIHDPQSTAVIPTMLAELTPPKFPTPIGIFYRQKRPSYEDLKQQIDDQATKHTSSDLKSLLRGTNGWQVD
jgi:2-oxoglutarate ferredoxin oxidoreductase subunit beta